jgi:hypothetical protein
MRTLGLIYQVSTHNGRRRRWRLSPAGLAIANASDQAPGEAQTASGW